MSAGIRGYSEKSTSFQALFWALELNEKIFSPHKQALSERMRWPAVPLLRYKLIVTTYIANYCEYAFPRKRCTTQRLAAGAQRAFESLTPVDTAGRRPRSHRSTLVGYGTKGPRSDSVALCRVARDLDRRLRRREHRRALTQRAGHRRCQYGLQRRQAPA